MNNLLDKTPREILRAARTAKVSEVKGYGWNSLMLFRKMLDDRSQIEASWKGFNIYQRQAPDMWVESTYDDCVAWNLNIDTMVLSVQMYDGDNFSGEKMQLRCDWKFQLQDTDNIVSEVLVFNILRAIEYRAAEIQATREEERIIAEQKEILESFFTKV